MKNIDIKELTKNEMLEISGGHKGFFYKLGHVWASSLLIAAGTLAGLSTGLDEGLKEK